MCLTPSRVLEVFEAGVLSKTVFPGSFELVDGRHFQILEDSTIQAASGYVRAIAALCPRRFRDPGKFLSNDWLAMVPKLGHQPSVLGFIVEDVVTSHVTKEGLTLDGFNLGGMQILQLGSDHPNLADPDLKLDRPMFYIPIKGNHKAIDAMIIRPDRGTLKIIAIQITINARHENSEVSFAPKWNDILMLRRGEKIVKDLPSWFDSCDLIFLWIVEDPEKFRFKPGTVPAGSVRVNGEAFAHPRYHRVVKGLKDVCPRLVPGAEEGKGKAERSPQGSRGKFSGRRVLLEQNGRC